jgi:hypothetical protein
MFRGQAVRFALIAAAVTLLAATGCGGVNRRFVIESNVPNAQVYINNRPIGAAPAHAAFEYYGYYNIELVHPDYQREVHRIHVRAPWYAYPPFDFLVEVLWPFRIDDVRRYNLEMRPAIKTDVGELIQQAEELRTRGWNLPAPENPAQPPPAEPAAPPAGSLLPPPKPVPAGVVPSIMP